MEKRYVQVTILTSSLPEPLTYGLPEDIDDPLGHRVIVPLGRSHAKGIVTAVAEKPDFNTKDISDFPDSLPALNHATLKLAHFISDYYFTPIDMVIQTMLPKGKDPVIDVKPTQDTEDFKLSTETEQLSQGHAEIVTFLRQNGTCTMENLTKRLGNSCSVAVRILEKKGLLTREKRFPKHEERTERFYRMPDGIKKKGIQIALEKVNPRAKKQMAVFHKLLNTDEISLKSLLTEFSRSSIEGLENTGLIESIEKPVDHDFTGMVLEEVHRDFELTDEQNSALRRIDLSIDGDKKKVFLLHGVTGSGKTQVYIEAARKVLSQGKGVLILVPEISLTPQLFGRFRAQLGEDIALIHSAVAKGIRNDQWHALRDGRIRVALGARSALFAPVQNLGLILCDEEHDGSFKQHSPRPYYNARDLAVVMGGFADATVILGSATPSMESYFNSKTGKYTLIKMNKRVGDVKLPRVHIVDMRMERQLGINGSFSRELRKYMDRALLTGQKVILLMNRRGYSTFLQCNFCGHVPHCPDCSVSMKYHITDKKLMCHICGTEQPAPTTCPECNHEIIRYVGKGTQKIEEEIRLIWSDVPVFRMDQDTTRKKGAMVDILHSFGKTRGAILIGTQMVAKGIDFPDVAVVGVLNADIGLTMPDFRAEERIYQLLTQVAGRAGRSHIAGNVVVQTFNPQAIPVQCAVGQKFLPFYNAELEKRKGFAYPPFSRLILIVVSSEDDIKAENRAALIGSELTRIFYHTKKKVMGPVRAPLERAKTLYRYHIIVKTGSVRSVLPTISKFVTDEKDIRIQVIPDPIDMM